MEELLDMLKYLLVAVNVLLFAMAVTVFVSSPKARGGDLSAASDSSGGTKRALLVTAHPDDESMFFLPLLRSLLHSERGSDETKWEVRLLVLSTGNFDGLGDQRVLEMRMCAVYLGIGQVNVDVVEDPQLQDGMQNYWSAEHISEIVLREIDRHAIDAVFTFDNHGVSGHPNHIATHFGVKKALQAQHERCSAASGGDEESKTTPVKGWALESTGLLRKYIGVLDAALSFWETSGGPSAFVFAFRPLWNYRAMALHRSQFVWYRRLFVVFSRYTFVNTFQPIATSVESKVSAAEYKGKAE